ncbi:hypothetical protein CLI64_25110 [Nostoc sp. CENA543]|uniref:hypothetical protein n=1 Tax=Nostoc sp. CENA543 TaxID=1869241 RepID=UPI000CA282AA|nr:hypothetical protein [Nostoc sp. CENA543]AUT03426.1 hypothetical protein CLI64_25110 [Nostoc sp. CENA543]
MQHLKQLLGIEKSALGQLLRYSLYGLEATLRKAQAEYHHDPGAELCDQVLYEIHNLLQVKEEAKPTVSCTQSEPKLGYLRAAFDADVELGIYLGNSPLCSQTDADLWNEIHRKLLRVPEDLAEFWRQRALDLAQEVGAIADNSHLHYLPFIRDEIIYPGLSGTVVSPGLCLSQKALQKTKILPESASEELTLLASFLVLLTKFIEIEPELYHAFKSVFSFDVIHLHSQLEQKIQYVEALGDRFHRTKKAEESTDPLSMLRAWLDMDEAIHSLIFVPPAERYSWWGKLQQESRRALKKVAEIANNAGHEVRIRQLTGLYADICALTKDDLQLECGGVPGEVLTCLRVYARINHEGIPGRVIFRSSR